MQFSKTQQENYSNGKKSTAFEQQEDNPKEISKAKVSIKAVFIGETETI